MKIILTGASGFVGKNLIPYLSDLGINSGSLSRERLGPDLIISNADAIIHLAGKAHDVKKVSDLDEYYQVNFELTRRLYDAFLTSEARIFIFISSVKAAADIVNDTLTEETVPNPQGHYGKSKLIAELYIQSLPLPSGKSYYILRPCMIHGQGNKGNLNLLYMFVKKRVPFPLAAFENKRSFLSVENLCFIIKGLLQKDIPSGIYNVADDEALSTNQVVNILASSLGKKPRLWTIPKSVIYALAKVGDHLKLPFTTERLNKLTENYVVSNEKIKKALNIQLPVKAEEGLMITAKSFNNS